jgi:hypothetical protein
MWHRNAPNDRNSQEIHVTRPHGGILTFAIDKIRREGSSFWSLRMYVWDSFRLIQKHVIHLVVVLKALLKWNCRRSILFLNGENFPPFFWNWSVVILGNTYDTDDDDVILNDQIACIFFMLFKYLLCQQPLTILFHQELFK